MKNLNKGDNVAVYVGGASNVITERKTGTVIDFGIMTETVWVKMHHNGEHHWCHRKQVRKVILKKKRREWWINVYPDGYTSNVHKTKEDAIKGRTNNFGTIHEAETILVREVMKK